MNAAFVLEQCYGQLLQEFYIETKVQCGLFAVDSEMKTQ